MERLGFGAIAPPSGMALIACLLRCAGSGGAACVPLPPPALAASVFFWDRLKAGSRLFDALRPLPAPGAAASVVDSQPAAASIGSGAAAAAAAGPALTAEALEAAVVAAVVSVLGEDPGPDAPLVGAGLDSLGELWWKGMCSPAGRVHACCTPDLI